MTKKELLEALEGVPDDALIYSFRKHGFGPELCLKIQYDNCHKKPAWIDDLDFRNMRDKSKVKQVLI